MSKNMKLEKGYGTFLLVKKTCNYFKRLRTFCPTLVKRDAISQDFLANGARQA